MKIPSLLALAAALGLGLAPAAVAQQPDTATFSFRPPAAAAGLALLGQEMLEEGGGAHLRYQKEGDANWIDVYVYPAGDSGCTQACDSVAVRRQSDDFAGLIPELLRRGYYDSLRVADDHPVAVTAAGRTFLGRHLVLKGGREGRRITSHFFLVGAGPVLVKFRLTNAPGAPIEGSLERFTHDFLDATFGPPDRADARS
ncbi:MAG TPA: hypothetical protein VJT67_17675 [Longimicrobiaceae bacterium]|nr:hypothetical protein [Longimicrobiaceae bacterium]